MSWASKSLKKLKKSATKVVKKAVRNPLAVVNPQTYFSGASIGAPAGAAAGKSASSGADLGGSGAVLGGAALSTVGAVGGAELGSVADAGKGLLGDVSLPRTAEGGIDYGAIFKFSKGFAADWGLGGMGRADAAASAEAAASYSPPVAADDGIDAGAVSLYALAGLVGIAAVALIARAVR